MWNMFPGCLFSDLFCHTQTNMHCYRSRSGRGGEVCMAPGPTEWSFQSYFHVFGKKKEPHSWRPAHLETGPAQFTALVVPRAWLDVGMAYAVRPGSDLQLCIKRKTNEGWFSWNHYPRVNTQQATASCNLYGFCHSWKFMVITRFGLNLFHLLRKADTASVSVFVCRTPFLSPGPKYNGY